MKEQKYKLEPCVCCRMEHHNPHGWIIRNLESGTPEYHLTLKRGQPTIGELPVAKHLAL